MATTQRNALVKKGVFETSSSKW